MSQSNEKSKDESKKSLKFLKTSADIKVIFKNDKFLFILSDGSAFSYSANYFRKILENSTEEKTNNKKVS